MLNLFPWIAAVALGLLAIYSFRRMDALSDRVAVLEYDADVAEQFDRATARDSDAHLKIINEHAERLRKLETIKAGCRLHAPEDREGSIR